MKPERVIQFFARMEHMYASKWSSAYGKPVSQDGELTFSARMWALDLARFTDDQIAEAIESMESLHPEWPPTVPQFKALCERLPDIEEIIDRRNNYGPVCAAIRAKLDWYNLTLLSSEQMRATIKKKMMAMLPQMRRDGLLSKDALTRAVDDDMDAIGDKSDD